MDGSNKKIGSRQTGKFSKILVTKVINHTGINSVQMFSCIFRGKWSLCTGTAKSISRYDIYQENTAVYQYTGIPLHP